MACGVVKWSRLQDQAKRAADMQVIGYASDPQSTLALLAHRATAAPSVCFSVTFPSARLSHPNYIVCIICIEQ
jgi:hypothetical protein